MQFLLTSERRESDNSREVNQVGREVGGTGGDKQSVASHRRWQVQCQQFPLLSRLKHSEQACCRFFRQFFAYSTHKRTLKLSGVSCAQGVVEVVLLVWLA